jgi:nucleotidyltransferase AbiEii toxin of type IV toxin-antitoxin system
VSNPASALWEPLYDHAMAILAPARRAAPGLFEGCSFGGGTVLMFDLEHRISKDVDIFVPDPQCLGLLTPRLNDVAASRTEQYDENTQYLKLYFPLPGAMTGEVDFIVAPLETPDGAVTRMLREHEIALETAVEIIAKKLRYRAETMKARDIFDIACVYAAQPNLATRLAPWIRKAAPLIRTRIEKQGHHLREDFEALDRLRDEPDFDACVRAFGALVDAAG